MKTHEELHLVIGLLGASLLLLWALSPFWKPKNKDQGEYPKPKGGWHE